MSYQLKNSVDQDFINQLAREFNKNDKSFNKDLFIKSIKKYTWEQLELKQRIHAIAVAVNDSLSGDYKTKLNTILKSLTVCRGLSGWVFPYYVELFGPNHFDSHWVDSIEAIKEITPYFSAEFAIRHFIVKNQQRTLVTLLKWSKDKNYHVRRLASEGCRPKLPWAIRLHKLVEDPSPILPILENLKDDPELYVRKSVANNLNDISKDHPQLVLKLAKNWIGKSKNTDWILKHGLRTLLKQGNKEAFALFELKKPKGVQVSKITFPVKSFKIGKSLEFTFTIKNTHASQQQLRIDYVVYYVKKSGGHSKKVFKLKESQFNKNSTYHLTRRHSLRQMTTRKHLKGRHFLEIVVNGVVMSKGEFQLI